MGCCQEKFYIYFGIRYFNEGSHHILITVPRHIGTCSGNYDSWVGLVYHQPELRSVDYLAEYTKRYRMVEVDSWFYKIPTPLEVEEYAEPNRQDLYRN